MSTGKKTGKKGFETEEILRSYFLGAGFFVVRGVKLRHNGDDLTDIDLWLYERSATLARRRIIIDVKDNATPKAAERLFFVKGLAEIVQVEATGIATSDSRRSLRELARKHNILWIDNADIQRLKSSQKLTGASRISEETLDKLIAQVDSARASRSIRDAFASVKSAVADRFGISCANTALDGADYFGRLALGSHPNSPAAEVFTRLVYLSCGIAAAALDFASGDSALRPASERLSTMTDAIRFGEDRKGTEEKLRWAEAAIRDYAPNGAVVSGAVRRGFVEAIKSVPADGLAEVAVKMATTDRLFRAGRDLEAAAYAINAVSFDGLSIDAKSILGAVLDFTAIDRASFARCWSGDSKKVAVAEDEAAPAGADEQPAKAASPSDVSDKLL